MSNPILSIIVPAYNLESIIANTITRLITESTGNEEIIIVDDGSTDNTLSICHQFEHYNFIKILHQENSGNSTARNLGLESAKGDFIWFFDGDDDLQDDSLKIIVSLINNCYNFDIIISNYLYCYENSTQKNHIINFPTDEVSSTVKGLKVLTNEGAIPVWCAIFNKSFLNKNGLRFKEGILHEDFEFSCRAYALAKRVKYLNKTLYRYRCQRPGSIMNVIREESPIGYATSAITLWEFIKKNDFSETDVISISKVAAIGMSFSFDRLSLIKDSSSKNNVFKFYSKHKKIISKTLAYHTFFYKIIGRIFILSPQLAFFVYKLTRTLPLRHIKYYFAR